MQIHESATCNVYKALNAIHVQCSAGHAPVYTSDHALMLCHAVDFTVYTIYNSYTSSPGIYGIYKPEGPEL